MHSENHSDMQVYSCTFELNIVQAFMTIKFPCSYSVQIKSMNNKITMATSKNKVNAVNSVAAFNQILRFETEVLYHVKRKEFVKKDVLLLLNLISTRRPDQQKLVGRVTIDLSQAISSNTYIQPQAHKLEYCSVNATITFGVKFMGKKASQTLPQNFDRDSFSDFQSFVAGIHTKQTGSSKQKSQEFEKTMQMPWKSKTNEGFDRNKIIEQIHNEDAQSRVNSGRASHKIINATQNISITNNKHTGLIGLGQPAQQIIIPKLPLQEHSQLPRSPIMSISPVLSKDGSYASQQKSQFPESYSQSRKEQYQHSNVVYTQPINQYEQILRTSHAQEKRIWEEEKRLFNQQILREKHQNAKFKERNESLQKKLYETELKLCNIQGKIQNSKRQMIILQRQKDLQIKQLKSRVQRISKQKTEKVQILQQKQSQIKQIRQKLRSQQNEKRKGQELMSRQTVKINQKMQSALKRASSSEQLLSKIQRQKQEHQLVVVQIEANNRKLQKQIAELNTEMQQKNKICQQFQTLKIENQKIQKQSQSLLVKLGQLQSQLEYKESQLQQTHRTHKSLSQQLQSQISALHSKIDQLQSQLGERQLEVHSLRLALQDRDSQFEAQLQARLKKENEDFNAILVQNQNQIDGLSQKLFNQEANKAMLEKQIFCRDQQIALMCRKIQVLQITIRQSQSNQQQIRKKVQQQYSAANREYTRGLEQQILQVYEQSSKKDEQIKQKMEQIDKMKAMVNEMKVYQKGLEQQILNTAENDSSQKMANLASNRDKISNQFQLYKKKSSHQINELHASLKKLNQIINQRNKQIHTILEQRNQLKEYSLGLQAQMLKDINKQQKSQKNIIQKYNQSQKNKIIVLQNQLERMLGQAKLKDSEIEKLKLKNIQLKQSQLGLEEQLMKVTQQISKLDSKKVSELSYGQTSMLQLMKGKSIQKQRPKFDNKQPQSAIQQKLQQKLRQLEQKLRQKDEYQKQLQRKILKDQQQIESRKYQWLQSRIKQLQYTIQSMKQYQQGLQQKILVDYQNVLGENVLKKDILELKKTIEHQRQYQQGLQQKILYDHNSKQKEGELKKSLQLLEQTIKNQKDYQSGLEEKILADHEQLQKGAQLKNSINLLQNKIKSHREYEEGLEEKILEDHQKLSGNFQSLRQKYQEELKQKDKIISQLKQYQIGLEEQVLIDFEKISQLEKLNKNDTQEINHNRIQIDDKAIHQRCREQKDMLEQIIQDLEANLMKLSEASPQKLVRYEDEDYLILQTQLNNKQQYIFQLQSNIEQLKHQNENLRKRNAGKQSFAQMSYQVNSSKQEDQQEPQPSTMIRVIEVHSASDDEEDPQIQKKPASIKQKGEKKKQNQSKDESGHGFALRKQSQQKSIIAQQPIINITDKYDEMYDEMDLINSHKKYEQDDMEGNPTRQMILKLSNKQIEQKDQTISKLQAQLEQINTKLQSKIDQIQKLKNQIEVLKSQQQNQSKLQQNINSKSIEQQNKSLKAANQQKGKQLDKFKQIVKNSKIYIDELVNHNSQYEKRIRLFKQKQIKISEMLLIVEAQSRKIFGEMTQKDQQNQQLKSQLSKKDSQLSELKQPRRASQLNEVSSMNSLISQNKAQQKQITTLKQKLSMQSDTTQKYEDLLERITELNQNNSKKDQTHKEDIQRIRKLELQLKQVNEQLVISKRLVTKLRESRQAAKSMTSEKSNSNNVFAQENKRLAKRVEQLEQQLFSYQSNDNQKQIQNQLLKTEVSGLKQQLQKSMSNPNTKRSSHQQLAQQQKQNQQISSQTQPKLRQQIQKFQKIIEGLQQKQKKYIQNLKDYENEIHSLQNLMKNQRLQYLNNRRQISQQKESAIKQLEQKNNQIIRLQSDKNGLQQQLKQKQQQVTNMTSQLAQQKSKADSFRKQKVFEKTEKNQQNQYIQDLEKKIVKQQGKIKQKQNQIEELLVKITNYQKKSQLVLKPQVVKNRQQIQRELQYYQLQLKKLTKKLSQIQPLFATQKTRLEQSQKIIQELTYQLQISQQQNQLKTEISKNSSKNIQHPHGQNSSQTQSQGTQGHTQASDKQLVFQLQNLKQTHTQTVQKLHSLQLQLKKALSEKEKALEELEERQMEHMNTQLDLQFKLREKNQKSQMLISSSDNQMKKSFNASQDNLGVADLVQAAKVLKELAIRGRDRQVQSIVTRVVYLEEVTYGGASGSKEKGMILQKTRLLSMEFSKFKVSIMKSKIVSQQRMKLLTCLKPFQNSIKDILKLSQIYCQNLLAPDSINEQTPRS